MSSLSFAAVVLTALLRAGLVAAINTNNLNIPSAASASAYCSSSDEQYQLSPFDAPVAGTGDANGLSTWSLSVDDTSSGHKQSITGFGAAVTDATVSAFNSLSDEDLSALLATLMTSSGADFGLVRHTIGASDLSADPAYSYDDDDDDDDAGGGFGLGDRGSAMAALLARMRTLKSGLTILGSSWSAPGWMKLNGVLDGTTVDNNLDPDHRGDLADYLVKYLQAYADAGAEVDAITIQNEPLNSQSGYPTMYVYADESGDIISQNIGPALQSAGLSTQIWAYDHNTDVPSYPQTVLDSAASSYVQAVAWHCYASDNDWAVLSDFHASNPDTLQYMTECWTSPSTGWSQAADFTMGPLQNWASGAMAWTLGTDASYGPHLSAGGCDTCRGLVVVGGGDDAGYDLAIDYYMMAQFSRFMPAGAVVLNGTGSYSYADGTGVQSVASANPDGTRTVVMTNKFADDVYVTVDMQSGDQWSGRVYQNSVVTWVLPAAS